MSDNNSTKPLKRDFGISDFLVDFLGALFPGLLFLTLLLLTLGSTILYFFHQIKLILFMYINNLEDLNILNILENIHKISKYYAFYLLLIVLIVSYIIGQFLYRKDIKEVDTASFIQIWNKMSNEEKEGWVEKMDDNNKSTNFIIEFPYRYLKKYFEHRKLNHLATLIHWDDKDLKARSKTFINTLKIRLQFYHPDKINNIIKNEAHIRLMSSIWHLLKYIKKISLFCVIINLLIFSIGIIWIIKSIPYMLISLFLSTLIFFITLLGKREIESFFHYQRVREIFYVLETAYTASLENEEIFKNIN